MAFEWHSKKAQSNLEKHGVSFEEATTVFDDPFAEFLPDLAHSASEQRFTCLGTSLGGRLLAVSFTEFGDDVRIISARLMEPKERRCYERGNQIT